MRPDSKRQRPPARVGAEGAQADGLVQANSTPRPYILQWRSAVLNSPTDSTCKLVLLVLAEFADAAGSNCWPAITSVAELAGTSERTTRRALDRAAGAGWIERTARVVRGQAWRLYHYQLTLPKGAVTESARSGRGAVTESGPSDETCGLSRPKVRTLTTEGAVTESADLAIDLGRATSQEQEQPVADAPAPADPASLEPERQQARGKSRRTRKPEDAGQTLQEWLDSFEDRDQCIRADDPIHDYARSIGLPSEFLELGWCAFREKYKDSPKRQLDWRAAFRTEVKRNWLQVWKVGRDLDFYLSDYGKQLLIEDRGPTEPDWLRGAL